MCHEGISGHQRLAVCGAAAVAAGAELFVTGDKRVLEWIASGSMRIASPRQAWIMLFEPQLNH
jgi:hypothetical protein